MMTTWYGLKKVVTLGFTGDGDTNRLDCDFVWAGYSYGDSIIQSFARIKNIHTIQLCGSKIETLMTKPSNCDPYPAEPTFTSPSVRL